MQYILVFYAIFPVRSPSPSKAMLYSAVFPGMGQFYNGDYVKGVIMTGVSVFLLSSAYVNYRESHKYEKGSSGWEFYRKEAFSFGLYYLGVYLYSIADAYVSAHLYGVKYYFNKSHKNTNDR